MANVWMRGSQCQHLGTALVAARPSQGFRQALNWLMKEWLTSTGSPP